MNTTELLEKIKSDNGVNLLINVIGRDTRNRGYRREVHLTGGALVDILDGRTPKDYDITGVVNDRDMIQRFKDAGFVFVSDTRTALTYNRNGMIVQFLKGSFMDFDYTISQTRYSFAQDTLIIDDTSWENKILVPTSYSPKISKSCLMRVPHWKNKGYELPEVTYYSLVNSVSKGSFIDTNIYEGKTWGS